SMAAMRIAAEAPEGLRIAATITSVSKTNLTVHAYHIFGDITMDLDSQRKKRLSHAPEKSCFILYDDSLP
ncbi:MAG: hypothetical protein ABIU05_07280, partial [Nitrospirales bacterium]